MKQNLPIGCHVSIAGGIWKAPERAKDLDCETFQIFSRSPQGGPAPKLDAESILKFKEAIKLGAFERFVIHSPYYINFGSTNPKIYHGSITVIRQELERGSVLGSDYVMFHPGSLKDNPKGGVKYVIDGIKKVLDGYDGECKMLIEISAGAGEVVGDSFEELAELVDAIGNSIGFGGICFDTQHAFASGYDLRTDEAVTETFKKFDKQIGLDLLKMSHVNDSKVEFGSKRDRHEHVGDGHIGKKGIGAVINYFQKKKMDIPLILETEHDKVQIDIKLLKDLRDSKK